MYRKIIDNVNQNKPLVHCITNNVTINDCANAVLACGGSPIMADDIREVEEIISICSALYLNIGTLNERTVYSMIRAGEKANELGKPIIFDPVGAGASKLRTSVALDIIRQLKCAVIRGNMSEIKTLYSGAGMTKGVDAAPGDVLLDSNRDEVIKMAQELSRTTGAVIAITGETDLVADTKQAYLIRNGHPLMEKITGTGCMLTAVIAAFCGVNQDQMVDATATAICMMGLSGELAYKKMIDEGSGTGSLRCYIIDGLSNITADTLEIDAKLEKA